MTSVQVRTVKVSNISLKASEIDLREFFSYSGEIVYLELKKSENEESQSAHVTFKDSQGADTAVLLAGATIAEKMVTISLDPEHELPPGALAQLQSGEGSDVEAALRKAEDVVTSMLAKGFILGKDTINKAKSLDEKHQLRSTASVKIASLDQKYGVTDKISMGTSAVNTKMKEVDDKYQVSEKTKSAIAVAEEKASNAGSAIMKNRYVLTGATWVTGALNRVAKAADEVGQKTKEKIDVAEDEQKRKAIEVEHSPDVHHVTLEPSSSPKAPSTSPAEASSSSPKASSAPTQQPSSKA